MPIPQYGRSDLYLSGGRGSLRIKFCLQQIRLLGRMEVLAFWLLAACMSFFLLNLAPTWVYLGMGILACQSYVMVHGRRLYFIAEAILAGGRQQLGDAGISGRSEVWMVLPGWGFASGAPR